MTHVSHDYKMFFSDILDIGIIQSKSVLFLLQMHLKNFLSHSKLMNV